VIRGLTCGTVQQAANTIEQFKAGLDAAGYVQNALVRAAVERLSQCADPWLCGG
jgi:hypothetical protein